MPISARLRFRIVETLLVLLTFNTLTWYSVMLLWWLSPIYSSYSARSPYVLFGYVFLLNTLSCLFLVLGLRRNSRTCFFAFWLLNVVSLCFSAVILGLVLSKTLGPSAYFYLVQSPFWIVLTFQSLVSLLLQVVTFGDSVGALSLVPATPSAPPEPVIDSPPPLPAIAAMSPIKLSMSAAEIRSNPIEDEQ